MAARLLTLVALAWAAAPAALACTLCDSGTANELRRAVFGPDFLRNLAAVATPAPILLGAIYAFARLEGRP